MQVYTKPGKTFVFGPEGEMGGTIFYAPAAYQKVGGPTAGAGGQCRDGTTLCHCSICACLLRAATPRRARPHSGVLWAQGALKPFSTTLNLTPSIPRQVVERIRSEYKGPATLKVA